MPGLDLSKINFPDEMNIREASLFLDLGEQRIRALVRTKVLKADDTTGRFMFQKKDLEAYRNEAVKNPRSRSESAAGKAFVIRIPSAKMASVNEFLGKAGLKLEPRYNVEAQKRAQAKQKAKKAAARSETAASATATPTTTPAPAKGVAGVLGRKSG